MVERSWTRANLNRQIGRIRQCFRYGVANELVRPDVYDALKALPGLRPGKAKESEPVKPAAIEHVNAALNYVSPQIAAMVQIQLLAGLRSISINAWIIAIRLLFRVTLYGQRANGLAFP
jgi:hypothetical protein